MTKSYIKNYIQAVKSPLPELKSTFEKELELLIKNSNERSVVLDVGCGIARPAYSFSDFVKDIVCIDYDEEILTEAKRIIKDKQNIKLLKDDALDLSFPTNEFDLVYATYNLIGSIKENQRQRLIDNMSRVANVRSKIINITWKNNRETTNFLQKYYSSIGIDILSSGESETTTSKGTFYRVSKDELFEYYSHANLKNIEFVDVGPVWNAIIRTK